MNEIQAMMLGVVQGLTEFLPVSSSGHLVLFQNLIGLREPEILFDISVHFGTLLAIVTVFRKEIIELLKTLRHLPGSIRTAGGIRNLYAADDRVRLLVFIGMGTLPTGILGLGFAEIVDRLFSSVTLVGSMLLITGTFLWFTRYQDHPGRLLTEMRWVDALLVGVAQGMAILPGISRSGATIAAALYLGIDRQLAGRYSFLLSIPAILGALAVGYDSEAMNTQLPLTVFAIGALSAAGIGYLALVVLLRLVQRGQLYRFAPYCWLIGGVALAAALF